VTEDLSGAGSETCESFSWYLKWYQVFISGQLNFIQDNNLIDLPHPKEYNQTNFDLEVPISLPWYKRGPGSSSDVNIWSWVG